MALADGRRNLFLVRVVDCAPGVEALAVLAGAGPAEDRVQQEGVEVVPDRVLLDLLRGVALDHLHRHV